MNGNTTELAGVIDLFGEGCLMITKDTRIIDVLQQSPKAAEIFEELGMGCIGCMGITMETIENGAKMHQISLEVLLKELNKVLEDKD